MVKSPAGVLSTMASWASGAEGRAWGRKQGRWARRCSWLTSVQVIGVGCYACGTAGLVVGLASELCEPLMQVEGVYGHVLVMALTPYVWRSSCLHNHEHPLQGDHREPPSAPALWGAFA